MKRIGSLVLAAASVSAVMAPGTASSAAKSKMLPVLDCKKQTSSILVPQSQAQALVPKGFTATGGPNGNEEAVWLYFSAETCGDEASPSLEMFESYVGVYPPKKYANDGGADWFAFDIGVEGPQAAAVAKQACATNFFDKAEIDASVTVERLSPAVASDASSEVNSGPVVASITVRGAGAESESAGKSRVFYSGGAKPRYFDRISGQSFFTMGQSTIVFTEPYLGLPAANASLGLIQERDHYYLRPQGGCKA